MLNTFKNLLLHNCPMIMKLGMGHYVLKLFESYMNDDLVLFCDNVKFGKTCFCTYQTKNSLALCNVLITHFCFIRCFYFVVVPNITVLSDRVPKYAVNAVYALTPGLHLVHRLALRILCPTPNSSLLSYPTSGPSLLYPNRGVSSQNPTPT